LGGHTDVAKYLLECNANIHAINRFGKSALSVAAANGKLNVVKLLVESRADVLAESYDGSTALCDASFPGHLEVICYLVENNADVNTVESKKRGISVPHAPVDYLARTPLHLASENGKFPAVKYLLSVKSDVNFICRTHQRNILQWSVQFGATVEVVELLINGGISPKAISKEGQSALHYAAQSPFDKADVMSLLVSKNCDIYTKDRNRITAMDYAVHNNSIKHVSFLMEQDTKRKFATSDIMSSAIETGNEKIVQLFLNTNYPTLFPDGSSVLHQAVNEGNTAIVKVLLEAGVDRNVIDYQGNTAEDCARENNDTGMLSLFETTTKE